MRKFQNIKILSFLFLIGLIATSCVHDDDYSVPDINMEEPNVTVNTDIATVKGMYRGFEPVRIESGDGSNREMYLEGYVISDDESGNIFKQLFIQNAPENPSAGVVISTQATDMYTKYGPGQKIYFRVDGLYIGEYAGLPTIGIRQGTDVGRIEIDDFESRILRSTTKTEIVPTTITLGSVNDESKLATLVKFEGVQFPDNLLGQYYGNLDNTFSVNRKIEDCDGRSVILRNSGYADFKNYPLPTGNGSLTAILSVFGNDAQLMIRDPRDVQMNEPRCGDDGGDPEPPSTDATLVFAGADFEDWNAFIGGLNQFGIKSYATQSLGTGVDNTASLNIATTPTTTDGNDYVFTANAIAGLPNQYSKITFYMKGSSSKSVSLNVYKTDGEYYKFNLGDLSSSATIVSAENNQYNGTINTGGNWVQVTLDLGGLPGVNVTAVGQNIFALKIGKNADYDLHFDNFTIE
ncbi:MAG TPA: DUF5689 domain-containing protein [Flavobacteriaceae bacterium]|nr:DUF5689 domain-containing protein [Flavobacteriaceae bacterium]